MDEGYYSALMLAARITLAERGGTHRQRLIAQSNKLRLDLQVGQVGVDGFIERIDDVGGRTARRADAEKAARFVIRHKLVP